MFDLNQYLSKYNPKYLNKDEVIITCPLCGKPKLTINIRKKLWHCWVCQEYGYNYSGKRIPIKGAGNIAHLVALLENCSYTSAFELVKTDKDIIKKNFDYIDSFYMDSFQRRPVPYPPYSKLITAPLPYMYLRGITMQDVYQYGLFYCDGGRYRNRLIFPVWEDGNLIFYQGRAMWDSSDSDFIKTDNCKGGDAGGCLFNLGKASSFPNVVITEGPIDAIHVGLNAVCTWGKHITDNQINLLYSSGVSDIVLLWDGPSKTEPLGAIPEMIRVVPKLSGIFKVRVALLPEGDPGMYDRNYLQNLIQYSTISANDFSRLNYL